MPLFSAAAFHNPLDPLVEDAMTKWLGVFDPAGQGGLLSAAFGLRADVEAM